MIPTILVKKFLELDELELIKIFTELELKNPDLYNELKELLEDI